MIISKENKENMVSQIIAYCNEGNKVSLHNNIKDAIWLWSNEESYLVSGDSSSSIYAIENTSTMVEVEHKNLTKVSVSIKEL